MNTKRTDDGEYRSPQPVNATLILKYPTPTSKPPQFWEALFQGLQISLGADEPYRQEFSVHNFGLTEGGRLLVRIWEAFPDGLEWADLLTPSSRLRLHGGGPQPRIESLPIPEGSA